MRSHALLFVVLGVVAPLARAEELQKLRSRGAELYYLDLDLRAAFARPNPRLLWPDGPTATRKR
jgi:hypothetical protein